VLRWALGLLVVALVATLFGAGGDGFATGAFRIVFYLFVLVLLAAVLPALLSSRRSLDASRRASRVDVASRA
jgi:uncharacterized membrane protein YtjA (UPF0391 family)